MIIHVFMKLSQIAKKHFFWPALLIAITLLFFYKSLFFGFLPFPGDLLVGQYEPYKSYSYLGFYPGAVPNKAQGPDVIKELLPWKNFASESLKKFQIPLWNPYNFSGNPILANFQSGVFYPINLIFLIFNLNSAWTAYIFLIPVLASLFTYLFLRRLKISPPAAVLGSIAYAFSLYMVVWIQYGNIGHTLLWLPAVLYLSNRLIEKISYKIFIALVVVAVVSILAGYIQGVFYIFAISILYFFLKSYLEKKLSYHKSLIFLSALIFPVFLSLFQILPTLELFNNSTRGGYGIDQVQKLLNPVWYLVTLFAPDFFGNPASRNFWFDGTYIERVSYFGLIPLIFAIFAVLVLFKKTDIKIFTIVFLSTLLISTDLLITKFFYLIPIPVISTTVPTRILSLFAFSGSVLAAFGFDHFLSRKNKKELFLIAFFVFIILILLFIFTSFYPKIAQAPNLAAKLLVGRRNLILPIMTSLLFTGSIFYYLSNIKLLDKNKRMLTSLFIIAITSFELFYYFQKITPFSSPNFMYPETPVVKFLKEKGGVDRFWGYGSAYIESNFQTYDKTFSPEGNDPLHIREYTELLSASRTGRVPKVLPRPDANVAPGFGKEDLTNNPFRQKVLNIAGVKYVLNKDETINGSFNPDYVTFPEGKYKLVWQEGFWQAYENLKVTPRYFISNKYIVAENSNRALRTLFNNKFNEQDTLILYEDPKIKSGKLDSSAALVQYSPNKVVFKTSSNNDGLFYLSDNYYPGWRAYVDGLEAKIFVANYTFRAVVVPSGSHAVVFEFKPKSFYYGLYASLAAIVPLLYFYIFIKRKYG